MKKFDLIIAEKFWEHLKWPIRATKNVKEMLSSSEHFLVTTPFLVRFHPHHDDCIRLMETGLKYFLMKPLVLKSKIFKRDRGGINDV